MVMALSFAQMATTGAMVPWYNLQTAAQSTSSLRDDCIKVVFSEMEFLPWDNPENIVSAEVETTVHQIKNNLIVLLFLIGGPANVINMAVFYKQGLQDRVNLCLFALSLADVLCLVSSVLLHGEQMYIQFTTKERFGPVFTVLTNHNVVVLVVASAISPVISTIIATERCLCVFSPLRFQTLLRTRTMAVILVVISVVMTGLYFIVVFRYRVGCVYDPVSGAVITTLVEGTFYIAHRELIDHLHSFVFGVGLAGVEMVVVTTTTIMTIVKLRQAVTWRAGASSLISQKELAITKVLVGNSILFIACTTPAALIRFSRLFLPDVNSGGRHHNLFLVGLWIIEISYVINSTFNFFVYYIMGSRYRETMWSLFSKKGKGKKSNSWEAMNSEKLNKQIEHSEHKQGANSVHDC